MPVYEYYCRACESKFERLRPIGAANQPTECPVGHAGAGRTLSLFAAVAKATSASDAPAMGGGCCGGGGCACGRA